MWGSLGIYSNSNNHNLEVPGSFEYFNPLTGTTAWGWLAGISMYGGVGRDTPYLKHGFQISFDQSNGPSYMDENLFGDGYLPDGLVLRQAFNDGWSWGGVKPSSSSTQWTRDALTALGTQNTPGIWVQLYVNGLYWGVYNAVAHIDSAYSAYFFGGQTSDYDVYHYSSDGFGVNSGSMSRGPNVQRGNLRKHRRHRDGQSDRPGQPDCLCPHGEYLNLPDFCDYIIVNYYGGNWDWDWHNYSAVYTPGPGFVFQDWDGEGMLQSTTANITDSKRPTTPMSPTVAASRHDRRSHGTVRATDGQPRLPADVCRSRLQGLERRPVADQRGRNVPEFGQYDLHGRAGRVGPLGQLGRVGRHLE